MIGGNLHKISSLRITIAITILALIAIIVIFSWHRNPLLNSFHLFSNQFHSIPKDFQNTLTNATYNKTEDTHEKNGDFTDSQNCNYGKGKWVPDEKRPLYSGSECKRYLSPNWACKLTQRPDFSFEKFKWQPQNCQIPSFTPKEFLKRLKNKTLAFVGDSLGRQQFQSLMCMITVGKPDPLVDDVGPLYDLVIKPGAIRPLGYAYRFTETNTTILFYWSSTLCELEPVVLNGSKLIALHLDRPVTFLQTYLHMFDVLVLNTRHHWNQDKFEGNHWELHANGKPVINPRLDSEILRNARDLCLRNIVKYLDSQIEKNPNLKIFLRTLSPRHFVNGDWNTGGSCDNTVPLTRGSEVVLDGASGVVGERGAVNGSRIRLLDITALSRLREEGHISNYGKNKGYDCLHWCLPGIPDSWNEILFAQI